MNPRADIWNVLHDGGIAAIDGVIPGDVVIRVNIPYLRRMFSEDGEDIIVRLLNCTRFTMKIWEGDVVTDNFEQIVHTGNEILSTDSEDVPVHIFTTFGEIDIHFDAFTLLLENGRPVTFMDLSNACDCYWDRREAKSQRRKFTR